jgi:RHS repeat-associated protein
MYRGEQYDSDLGLYYLRARYYNPQTGRFLSRDPEDGNPRDPATLHKYLYAGGDPVNRIDPRGRDGIMDYFYAAVMVEAMLNENAQLSLMIHGRALCITTRVLYILDGIIEKETDKKPPEWVGDILGEADEWCEENGFI